MSGNGERSEGRLSRWSRRKLAPESPAPVAVAEEVPGPDSGTASEIGNLNVRGLVKPMAPLAGPEEGEPAYAAAQPDALALLNLEQAPEQVEAAALQAFPVDTEDDGEDVPLTPEQEAAVKDLPPVESLDKDSDFTPFFGPNIPDFLKRQAFKALWVSSPFFGFQDGLDDYAENFRIIEKILTAVDSDYKPSRGYEAAEKEVEDAAEAEDEDDVGDGDDDESVGDEVVANTDEAVDETPKEPRKSDVRPPEDAV